MFARNGMRWWPEGKCALLLSGFWVALVVSGCDGRKPEAAGVLGSARLRVLPVAALADQPLTFQQGNIALPTTLTERTVLEGASPSVTSAPGVLGSVTDVRGTLQNGECKAAIIHVTSVPPGSVLKNDVKVELTASSQIHFNDIVEKQTSLEVGYLVFSLRVGKDDRAEVLIEDVAEQTIENYDRDKDPAKLAAVEAKPLSAGACGRYVITRVVLTAIKSRVYLKQEQRASILGVLQIGGRRYFSHSKQVNDLKLGVVLRPIAYQNQQGTRTLSPAPPRQATLVEFAE